MRVAVRKVFVTVFCLVLAMVFTACINKGNADDGGSSVSSNLSGDAPITSKWEFSSSMYNGNVEYRVVGMDENKIPHFKTEDGVNFELTITGEKWYRGTITQSPDGTYELHNPGNGRVIYAYINGATLTIVIKEGSQVEFTTDWSGTDKAE